MAFTVCTIGRILSVRSSGDYFYSTCLWNIYTCCISMTSERTLFTFIYSWEKNGRVCRRCLLLSRRKAEWSKCARSTSHFIYFQECLSSLCRPIEWLKKSLRIYFWICLTQRILIAYTVLLVLSAMLFEWYVFELQPSQPLV